MSSLIAETARLNPIQDQDIEHRSSPSNKETHNPNSNLCRANSVGSNFSPNPVPSIFKKRVAPLPPIISRPITSSNSINSVKQKVTNQEVRNSNYQQNPSTSTLSHQVRTQSEENLIQTPINRKRKQQLQEPEPIHTQNRPNQPRTYGGNFAKKISTIIENTLSNPSEQQGTLTSSSISQPPQEDSASVKVLECPPVKKVVHQFQPNQATTTSILLSQNQPTSPIKKISLNRSQVSSPLLHASLNEKNSQRLQSSINEVASNQSTQEKISKASSECSTITSSSFIEVQKPPILSIKQPQSLQHLSIPIPQNIANASYNIQSSLQLPSSSLSRVSLKTATVNSLQNQNLLNSSTSSPSNIQPAALVAPSSTQTIPNYVDVDLPRSQDPVDVDIPKGLTYKNAVLCNLVDNKEDIDTTIISDMENGGCNNDDDSETNPFSIFSNTDSEFPALEQQPKSPSTKYYGCIRDYIEEKKGELTWRTNLTTLEDRFNYMLISPKYSKYHDAKFEVGPDKTIVSAHRSVLSLQCSFFQNLFKSPAPDSRQNLDVISWPDVDPVGLKEVFRHMYTGQFVFVDGGPSVEAISKNFAILNAAKKCGYVDLASECMGFIRSHLNFQNVADLYNRAFIANERRVMEIAFAEFRGDTIKVLRSDGFLSLTEDALCSLLENDEWTCHEREVFEAVKRWAIKKFTKQNRLLTPTGEELREAMGRTLFLIRFNSLIQEEFNDLTDKNKNLFLDIEEFEFFKYFRRTHKFPEAFTPKHRGKSTAPSDTIAFETKLKVEVENMELEIEPNILLATDIFEDSVEEEDQIPDINEQSIHVPEPELPEPPKKRQKTTSSNVPSPVPPKKKQKTSSLNVPAPPNKKQKVISSNVSPSELVPLASTLSQETSNQAKTLQELVKTLLTDTKMEVIDSVLKINIVPTRRVYLPNLTDFHLMIKRTKNSDGSSFRSSLKTKLGNLKSILFFNKEPNGTASTVLKDLMEHKVNVTLKINEVDLVVLSINHREGNLVISYLKDAQEIIDNAQSMQLKKLAVNECDLKSLDLVQRDRLEVIVMRRVKGLKDHQKFLNSCTKLREVCWLDMGSEELNSTEFLRRNPAMKKLSVAKCKFTLSNSLDGDPQNHLQELYTDNCDWQEDFVNRLPELFPHVRRIQIYGNKCDSLVFYSALKMKSLEWIFLWEMAWKFKRVAKKMVPIEQTKKLQDFLAPMFSPKNNKLTFILERKKYQENLQDILPGTSSSMNEIRNDPFNSEAWTGESFNKKEAFPLISKLDYSNFDYNEFFLNYNEYLWSETTEADKKKGRQSISATNPASNCAEN